MVTQIYTAPIKVRPPQTVGMHGAVDVSKQQAQTALTQGEDLPNGASKGLAAVQEQAQKGVISIQSILHDFHSTMDALGVPDDVRADVAPYLQVVIHQAQKAQPAAGLMKQNFKAASDTLDSYISEALGQKSSVVRDWVDALLLQPIDYKSSEPLVLPGLTPAKTLGKSATEGLLPTEELVSPLPHTTTLSPADQGHVKTVLTEAKAAQKAGQTTLALERYQALLNQARTQGWPDVEARTLYQRGKLYDQQKQVPQAQADYEDALNLLDTLKQPKLHAKVHRAMGGLLTRENRLDDALAHFTAAMVLDTQQNDSFGQSLTLNAVGHVYQAQGDKESALKAFQEALQKSGRQKPAFASEVLQNIATLHREAGRPGTALRYLKESLDTAKKAGHKAGMKSSLENIASVYLETGKPEKAYKALQSSLFKL